jgi:hypothetical protein
MRMSTANALDSTTQPPDLELSLVRGGPFYRAQEATRLVHSNQWNHLRRVTFAIAVGWMPLILITAVSNPKALGSLLRDYRVSSRLLIAVPVLLLGQALLESRFRMVIRKIADTELLGAEDRARMNHMIDVLRRLRDSWIPEVVIIFLVVVHTLISFKSSVDATPWLAYRSGSDLHLTAAGLYAVLISATLFQFLLGVGIWQWLLWAMFAMRLSRLNLKLFPTHPDRHGGLGFLGLTAAAFAPVSFSVATVIGATWRDQLLHHDINIMALKSPALVLLGIIATIALGPLLFFVPRLALLRFHGLVEYGTLGQIHSAAFHSKWFEQRADHETELLTAHEISTLAAFSKNYEHVDHLVPFPADRMDFLALALSLALPMLPVVLAVFPLIVVMKGLLKALK